MCDAVVAKRGEFFEDAAKHTVSVVVCGVGWVSTAGPSKSRAFRKLGCLVERLRSFVFSEKYRKF